MWIHWGADIERMLNSLSGIGPSSDVADLVYIAC